MKETIKVLYRGGEGTVEEKKSRFIASLAPVNSEEEVLLFLDGIRKKYRDASHHCLAFLIGDHNELMRCSDDGEPAQTAGRPMLNVLEGEQVHNACAVVTRYFGGTLLGTGGLTRAYSKAVQEGLKNSIVLERRPAEKIVLSTDYSGLGKINYILGEMGVPVLDSVYSDQVAVTALVPLENADELRKQVAEGTGGRCKVTVAEQVYFGMNGKEIVYL